MKVNLNDNERKVLRVLVSAYGDYADFCFLNFRGISRRSGLPRQKVRLACRSLKRKGLSEFGKGLWTEDGEVAGSGYRCTDLGRAHSEGPP